MDNDVSLLHKKKRASPYEDARDVPGGLKHEGPFGTYRSAFTWIQDTIDRSGAVTTTALIASDTDNRRVNGPDILVSILPPEPGRIFDRIAVVVVSDVTQHFLTEGVSFTWSRACSNTLPKLIFMNPAI